MMNSWNSKRLAAVTLGAAMLVLAGCGENAQDKATPETPAFTPTAAHSHPEGVEACFICDPALRDKGRLWCREHGRYEDRCWQCHPEIEDTTRLFCDEHGLYEDECFLCDPARAGVPTTDDGVDPAADNKAKAFPVSAAVMGAGGLYCVEHDVGESECAICHPELASTLDAGQGLKVRFASAEGPRKAGIRTAPARTVSAAGLIEGIAEARLNANRMARITPMTAGVVKGVLVDVGHQVRAGAPLVEIHSAEAASAKAEFLAAVVDLDLAGDTLRRESALREKNISSEQDYLAALASFRRSRIGSTTARQRLLNIGLSEEEVEAVAADDDGSATILLRAPFDGEIVTREAVVGEAATPGVRMLTIADRSSMWIDLSINADAAARLEIGAPVEARFDALPGVVIEGRLTWIDATIDPRSRLLRARAVVDDPDRRLKAGLYGKATVVVTAPAEVVRVPRDAVQYVSGLPFVFVRVDDDLFEARRVELSGLTDREADIVAGVEPGEPVVVTGAFTVMSEMLKARLGAGCLH